MSSLVRNQAAWVQNLMQAGSSPGYGSVQRENCVHKIGDMLKFGCERQPVTAEHAAERDPDGNPTMTWLYERWLRGGAQLPTTGSAQCMHGDLRKQATAKSTVFSARLVEEDIRFQSSTGRHRLVGVGRTWWARTAGRFTLTQRHSQGLQPMQVVVQRV